MHRSRWAALFVVVLCGAGCGRAAQPATEPVVQAAGDTAVTTTPAPDVPVDTAVVESVSATTPSETTPSDGDEGTLPASQPSQTELSGLSLDDPLPPQPDARTDAAGAEVAVRFAFEHWILVDLDAGLRGRLIEHGDEHATEMADGMARQRTTIGGATIGVESVTFDSADHAEVSYQVYWFGHPSPYFPEPRDGEAVLRGGTWRVAASDVCVLALGVGLGCPLLDNSANPDPPAALRLTDVPDGLTWDGAPDSVDVVRREVPPGDSWIGAGQSWMTIWFNARPGVSQLSAEDADDLLMNYTGGSSSVPVTIGGRPARYVHNLEPQQDGSTVEQFLVALIRADDVIVQANVNAVPIDEVLRALESLTPTE